MNKLNKIGNYPVMDHNVLLRNAAGSKSRSTGSGALVQKSNAGNATRQAAVEMHCEMWAASGINVEDDTQDGWGRWLEDGATDQNRMAMIVHFSGRLASEVGFSRGNLILAYIGKVDPKTPNDISSMTVIPFESVHNDAEVMLEQTIVWTPDSAHREQQTECGLIIDNRSGSAFNTKITGYLSVRPYLSVYGAYNPELMI